MAYEVLRIKLGVLTAAADLSAKQFYAVKVTAANAVNLAGLGESAVGILQGKPISGEAAELAISGDVSKMVAGGAVAAGDKVAVTALGKAKVAASGEYVIGTALNAAGADLELFSVLLENQGKV